MAALGFLTVIVTISPFGGGQASPPGRQRSGRDSVRVSGSIQIIYSFLLVLVLVRYFTLAKCGGYSFGGVNRG